ncbi:MAG: peptidoglycan endopeptidase [Peptococcaceae bacterium]|nr:peptidoglycan endopeptidase [Peptococcaceae bacterium]
MKNSKLLFISIVFGLLLVCFTAPAFANTYYSVKSGDSLWSIANRNGVPVSKIQELNSLKSTVIHPGQSLIISKDGGNAPAVTVSRGISRSQELLDYARSLEGTPYSYGGQSEKGFDCSGYVKYVFLNTTGINLPRTAAEQYSRGTPVSRDDAKPGDLVFFQGGGQINHSGIYLGGGKFISSTSSSGVLVTSVNGSYWAGHFYGYSRIIP